MHQLARAVILSVVLLPLSGVAQQTPPAMVATYDALADTILSVKRAEVGFVRALLGSYLEAARTDYGSRDYAEAAANMALFANEGDNAIAGIRKRLVEGGHHHHHHASDDDTDEYDQGYVIVNKASKATLIEAAAQMRQAKNKGNAKEAWKSFETTAAALLATE